MKPWLLNILACPIDKTHPLEAYFFSWQLDEENLEKQAKEQGSPNTDWNEKYKLLLNQVKDTTINPEAIKKIYDETGSEASKKIYSNAINAIDQLINKNPQKIEDSLKEIDELYRYLNVLEVKEGLLYCTKCHRWYPIGCAVETIPELMPDELREHENEYKWLEKWKEKIPKKILESGLPINLYKKYEKP